MHKIILIILVINFVVPTQCHISDGNPIENNVEQEVVLRHPLRRYVEGLKSSKPVVFNTRRYKFIDVVSYGDFYETAHVQLKSWRFRANAIHIYGPMHSARLFATSNAEGIVHAEYEADVLKKIDKKFHSEFPKFVEKAFMKGFMVIVTYFIGDVINNLNEEPFGTAGMVSLHDYLLVFMLNALSALESSKLKHNNISPKTVGRRSDGSFKLFGFRRTQESSLFSPWEGYVKHGTTDAWYGGMTMLAVALKNTTTSIPSLVKSNSGQPLDTCDKKDVFFPAVKEALASKVDSSATVTQGQTYVDIYVGIVKEIICGSLKKADEDAKGLKKQNSINHNINVMMG